MKNITFNTDLDLMERARMRAEEFDRIMDRLKHVDAGRKFIRAEMNERKPQA